MKYSKKIIKEQAITDMQNCLKEHELPNIEVPEMLINNMKKIDKYVWGTHSIDPYLLEGVLNKLNVASTKNFFLLGMGGHGFNSTCFSIFINTKPLMYLFQIPFGGINHDQEKAIKWIQESIKLYKKAYTYAKYKSEKTKTYAGKKLVLVNRHFIDLPCWSWLDMRENVKIIGWKTSMNLKEALT